MWNYARKKKTQMSSRFKKQIVNAKPTSLQTRTIQSRRVYAGPHVRDLHHRRGNSISSIRARRPQSVWGGSFPEYVRICVQVRSPGTQPSPSYGDERPYKGRHNTHNTIRVDIGCAENICACWMFSFHNKYTYIHIVYVCGISVIR